MSDWLNNLSESGYGNYNTGTGTTVYSGATNAANPTRNTNNPGSINPWLSQAFQGNRDPNQDYQSYLEGLGMDIDPSEVGHFFGGIAEDYQEDVGMARAGFAQGMSGLRTQGQGQVMQLGGGQGLSSIGGGGFGRQGYGMQQGLQGIGQQYGQGLQSGLLGFTGDLQSARRGMESSFRDVATGLLGRDSGGISWESGGNNNNGNFTGPSGWTGGTPSEGTTWTDQGGEDWIYENGNWKVVSDGG